jgi:hypothetical protein
MSHRTLSLALGLVLVLLPLTPACDDSEPPASPAPEGKAACEELADLCHEVGLEFGGKLQECHVTAEKKNGEVCLSIYDECEAQCRAAQGVLGGGGAGGEGHGGEGHGGEGHGHAGEAHGGDGGESH